MKKQKFNYHGHTYLCGHATGVPVDYVNQAIEHNYTHLGITEHAPMPNLHNKHTRLNIDDYDLYFELLAEAEKLANENNIKFFKGLEIEYFNDLDVYSKYLKDVDYLILGQHYIVKNGNLKSSFGLDSLEDVILYRDLVIEGLKSGYFNLLCHPDLCFFNIDSPTDEMYEALRPMIKVAKSLGIPLELNANGIRRTFREQNSKDPKDFKYPRIEFFQMVKEEGAEVIISSDCHNPEDLHDWAIDASNEFAESLNLKLIDKLDMKYNKHK